MKISLRSIALYFYDLFYPNSLRVKKVKSIRKEYSSWTKISASEERKIFVDISVIIRDDAGTGIQRVVKEIADLLIKNSKGNIFFVAAFGKNKYRCVNWNGYYDREVFPSFSGKGGNVFLGLDYSLDTVRRHKKQLEEFRAEGGKLWFLIHDILPVQFPEWFSKKMVVRYRIWLDVIASLSEGFFCNSEQTKNDFKSLVERTYNLHEDFIYKILPMGFSFKKEERDSLQIKKYNFKRRFVLMVGTIEPRKGHIDILRSFSLLLKEKDDVDLVIVGKEGWKIKDTIRYMKSSPFFMERIFWFDDVSDEELDVFYKNCLGLVMASYAEGYGLPIIEALSYKKPVFARDIPVFAQHKENGVVLFSNERDYQKISNELSCWLRSINNGLVIKKPKNDWKDAINIINYTLEK